MRKWEKVPEGKFEKEPVRGTATFKNERGQYSVDGNVLIRKWSSKARGFMAIFSSFWCGFCTLFIGLTWNGPITINGTYYSSLQAGLKADPSAYFIVIFPLTGLIMAYVTLALWINKTTIKMSSRELEIIRGPLPWRGSHRKIKKSLILQCWVEMYSSYSKNDVPVYSFRVKASLRRGNPIVIENGMRTYYEARVLEQWLETKLNIEDEHVPGEHVA